MVTDILYHDNTAIPSCDEHGRFLNNWNTDGPFEDNEYIKVYFRITTPTYFHSNRVYSEMCMFDSQEERTAFYDEVEKIFTELGWEVTGQTNLKFGKSHLYAHPKEISGTVKKWEVAYIAEKLAKDATLFTLDWVDLYRTVYDISDKDYAVILEDKRDEIRNTLIGLSKTGRRNRYVYEGSLIDMVASRVRILRVGITDGYGGGHDMTEEVVKEELQKLKDKGVMVSSREQGKDFVRAIIV